jgi:hypothetical protein
VVRSHGLHAASGRRIWRHWARNGLYGPGSAATNLALFKNVPLPFREGLRLQFRTELFNIFNQVNLSNPNATLSAGANMGRITSTSSEARVIQFALKVIF